MRIYIGILDGGEGTWGIRIPDLPGCYGAGATPEAAITDATSAAREWAEDELRSGRPISEPRPLTAVMSDAESHVEPGEVAVAIPLILDAGRPTKTSISLDAGLLEAIDAAAQQAGLTRSAFIASAAREKLGI